MNDARLVCRRKRSGDLQSDGHRVVHRQCAARQAITQRLSFHHFHGDEAQISMRSDFVDVRDIRMMESRRRLRFLDEATNTIAALGRAITEHLDRNVALEVVVVCQIDLAHAARAKKRTDFVPAESRAWGDRHKRSGDCISGVSPVLPSAR